MSKNQTMQEWFAAQLEEYREDPEFILEGVLLDLSNRIAIEMEKQGISRSELARRMGKKPPFITRILKGATNLTFSTAVQISVALGLELAIDFKPLAAKDDSIVRNQAPQTRFERDESRIIPFFKNLNQPIPSVENKKIANSEEEYHKAA